MVTSDCPVKAAVEETAFYNGRVYTSDEKCPSATCFVVRDGKFAAIGSDELAENCRDREDLHGRCVIPGLVDSHCHILSGLQRAAANVLFLDQETSPEGLADAILESSDMSEEGLITAFGIDITRGTFSNRDLDGAFPDRPVMVFSVDGHALLLNSRSMEMLGIDRNTEDPDENSRFVRDEKGDPTGLVIEIPAMMLCKRLMDEYSVQPTAEDVGGLLYAYAAKGYTAVFDAMSQDEETQDLLPLIKSFDETQGLTLRFSASFCYHGEAHITPQEALDCLRRMREEYDSENLRADTLKLITDGTVEEHSALLFEPYSDMPESRGSELLAPEDMEEMANLAAKEGFNIHIHAIGDMAVKRALDTLIGTGNISGTKTIAHNQLYRPEDIERIIKAGDIFFQTTPHWVATDDYTLSLLGEERYSRQFPVGTVRNKGVTVCFGSDNCLDEPSSNAFCGMYYAVNRGADEKSFPPENESITRAQALEAYTISGARQLGWDKETGSITPGKSADFLVLDRDIFDCPLDELPETQVEQTCFRGKAVFRKAEIQEGAEA